jgi:uncharacterized membrane protein YdbT with pleckstrin-like domain
MLIEMFCSSVSDVYVWRLIVIFTLALIYCLDYFMKAWCLGIVLVEVFIQNFDQASWCLGIAENSH